MKQLTEEQQELAEEKANEYDSGIGTMAVPDDELQGFIGIFRAAEVDFEHVEEIDCIYFDYPDQSPAGDDE